MAGFYPANQSNLKGSQKALIGWKKAGPPKKPLLFDHVNRLNVTSDSENIEGGIHKPRSMSILDHGLADPRSTITYFSVSQT